MLSIGETDRQTTTRPIGLPGRLPHTVRPQSISIDLWCVEYIYYSAPDRGAEYCDYRVCLCVSACVCLSTSTCLELHVRSSPNFCVCYLCPWLGRCDTLCTSGFMDDVILAHKPRQLSVAQPTCSLGLGYKRRVGISVVGRLTHTHGPTLRALRSGPTTPQWACWIFMTSCLDVTAYIATRKWRVLTVTAQVASPGRSLRSMTALYFYRKKTTLVNTLHSLYHCC